MKCLIQQASVAFSTFIFHSTPLRIFAGVTFKTNEKANLTLYHESRWEILLNAVRKAEDISAKVINILPQQLLLIRGENELFIMTFLYDNIFIPILCIRNSPELPKIFNLKNQVSFEHKIWLLEKSSSVKILCYRKTWHLAWILLLLHLIFCVSL